MITFINTMFFIFDTKFFVTMFAVLGVCSCFKLAFILFSRR